MRGFSSARTSSGPRLASPPHCWVAIASGFVPTPASWAWSYLGAGTAADTVRVRRRRTDAPATTTDTWTMSLDPAVS